MSNKESRKITDEDKLSAKDLAIKWSNNIPDGTDTDVSWTAIVYLCVSSFSEKLDVEPNEFFYALGKNMYNLFEAHRLSKNFN